MMAAQELRDFFETGSIRNSINLPDCQVAPLSEGARITIIHHNTPNMVGQITNVLASHGCNIADMINKSKGEVAYTVLNVDGEIPAAAMSEIEAIDGVIRLRQIV